MKHRIPFLKVGSVIQASVEEIISDSNLIVAVAGDLIRVQNETGQNWLLGQTVELVVIETAPLRFRIVDRRWSRESLDLKV